MVQAVVFIAAWTIIDRIPDSLSENQDFLKFSKFDWTSREMNREARKERKAFPFLGVLWDENDRVDKNQKHLTRLKKTLNEKQASLAPHCYFLYANSI